MLGGDVETVKLLLTRGALDRSKSLDPFESPVVLAAVVGNQPIVELLVKHSVAAEESAGSLNGSLHWAGFGQKASVARSLALSGANVQTPFSAENHLGPPRMDGILPLHWAAYNELDTADFVRLLLQKGADVNAVNDAGETTLDWGNKRGHRQIIAALTEAGGKPSNRRAKTKLIPNRVVPSSGPARQHFVRKSVEQALALMERSSDAFIASGPAQTQNCVSCHHSSLTSMAANCEHWNLAASDDWWSMSCRPIPSGQHIFCEHVVRLRQVGNEVVTIASVQNRNVRTDNVRRHPNSIANRIG